MIVCELGDRVAGAFVNRAGHFSALDMHDADVHVCCGQRCGKSFVAIADQHHDVGLEAVKFAGELDDGKSKRFGHGRGRRSFQLNVDFPVYGEPVVFDVLDRMPEALKNHGSRCDQLKLQFGPFGNFVQHRFEPSIIGAVHKHYTHLSLVSGILIIKRHISRLIHGCPRRNALGI